MVLVANHESYLCPPVPQLTWSLEACGKRKRETYELDFELHHLTLHAQPTGFGEAMKFKRPNCLIRGKSVPNAVVYNTTITQMLGVIAK